MPANVSKLNGAFCPYEKLCPNLFFKQGDMAAEGWLGNVEFGSGLCVVERVCQLYELSHMIRIQAFAPHYLVMAVVRRIWQVHH